MGCDFESSIRGLVLVLVMVFGLAGCPPHRKKGSCVSWNCNDAQLIGCWLRVANFQPQVQSQLEPSATNGGKVYDYVDAYDFSRHNSDCAKHWPNSHGDISTRHCFLFDHVRTWKNCAFLRPMWKLR